MDRHNVQKCESLVILQFISSEFWEEEKKKTHFQHDMKKLDISLRYYT